MRHAITILVVCLVAIIGFTETSKAQTMVYLGGLGSTSWMDSSAKGSTPRYSNLSWISRHVNAQVDQRNDHQAAVQQLKGILDAECNGNNWCYIMAYSNGGAVATEALSMYPSRWSKVAWIFTSAGNQGGSRLANQGWMSELFGGCDMADEVGPSVHRRAGWNHHAVGTSVYNVGGDGWCWGCGAGATHAIVSGNDDGVVGPHSAYSYTSSSGFDHGCQSTQWTNHFTAYTCNPKGEDHYKVKTQHIQCLEGGGC